MLTAHAIINLAQAETIQSDTFCYKIVVSDRIQVQIIRSENYSIEIKTQEVEDKCLIKNLENGILTLKLVSGFGCQKKVIVNITCPSLKEIEITGNAEVSTGNLLTGDSLMVIMRSGGKAYLDMDIKFLEARLSEGAVASLEGYAIEQKIMVSTSAIFSGWKLEGDVLTVNAASSAIAKVFAEESIQAVAGTGGYIGIKGEPGVKTLDSKANGQIEILTD